MTSDALRIEGAPLDKAYALLSGDDPDERSCEAIPEGACTSIPRNYVLNVANGACTKLAEQLASPGIVLAWLVTAIGAPAAAGFLVPVKQAGSLAPQMLVAARIRAVARRKWVWAGAGASQAVFLLLMIPAILFLPPVAAGSAVVILLLAFSIASGAGSVAFQDVVGKTIPKGRRGRMLGNRATIGGAITLAAAVVLMAVDRPEDGVAIYIVLIVAAAALWAAGAFLFSAMVEAPGATEGGRSIAHEIGAAARLFRINGPFRTYLLTRALLLSIELAIPYYALTAHALFDGSAFALGSFVLAAGLANLLSSHVWGTLADRSARAVMAASGVVGALAAGLALLFPLLPAGWRSPWVFAVIFVVAAIAEAGIRLGRKTYIVDGAPDHDRPLYVAFSNTSIGVLTLALGALGLLAEFAGPRWVIGILMVAGLLGALVAATMPPTDKMREVGTRD